MSNGAAISSRAPDTGLKWSPFGTWYAKFAFVLLVVTIITLVPFFDELRSDEMTYSPQLVVHGFVFLAWYALFSVQAGLVSSGRTALHRKLGYSTIPLAVMLFISGALLLIAIMQNYQPERTRFVWAIIHTLSSFTIFYLLAIAYRKRPEVHKRFMLLASLSMMIASITRVAYLPIVPMDGSLFTLLSSYVLIATPLVLDRLENGRIHPALKYGTLAYAVSQIVTMAVIPSTSIGQSLAFFR